MKTTPKKRDKTITLSVLDRRNPHIVIRSTHRVRLLKRTSDGLSFSADWHFPAPAIKRTYIFGKKPVSIEECGYSQEERHFIFYAFYI
jgi:hypothetical protein